MSTPAPAVPRQGGYLAKKCLEAAAKDNMPATYPAHLKAPYSAFTLTLMDSGNQFEAKVGDAFAAALGERALVIEEDRAADGERTEGGKRAKEEATFAAVVTGRVDVIFNARLGGRFEELMAAHTGAPGAVLDAQRVSEPDAMVRGPQLPSGLWSWFPVDVKDHRATAGPRAATARAVARLTDPFPHSAPTVLVRGALNRDDWVQLAHYYRHFQSVGIATPDPLGAVIGRERDGALELVWESLNSAEFQVSATDRTRVGALSLYDTGFQAGVAAVANARARDVDPTVAPVTAPEWKGDCADCPWKNVCLAELTSAGNGSGHITLLPGVTPARAAALYYPAQVRTTAQLAALTDDEAIALAHAATGGKQGALGDKAAAVLKDRAQARVRLSGTAHRAPGVAALELPSADVELDIDLESDERLYLYGIATTRRSVTPDGRVRYHRVVTQYDDYTNTDRGEARVFAQTWAHLQRAISRAQRAGQTIRIYHYSAHERTWFRNLAAKHQGVPGCPSVEAMAALLDSGVLVDMYAVTRTQVLWPTLSHSIKQLAPMAGFRWRDQHAGGDQSISWYRDAVAALADGDQDGSAHHRNRLRVYNRDDVLATAHLRAWLYANGTPDAPGAALPAA